MSSDATDLTAKTEQPQTNVLLAESLVKHYRKRTVVNGIKVKVRGGEIVGLLGPNGAGKTTCFYMIVGLVKPTAGRILLNGENITRLPMYCRARMGVGYLPQEPSAFTQLSVRNNLRAVAELLPLSAKERKRCIDQHLEELELAHLADQQACTLSGGERRRLEISRALVIQPKFFLMDEPFSGVDPINVSEVQSIVISLKEKGIGVLITDHNVRETLKIVDRAYVMHKGQILFEGHHEVLANDPACREFYLGKHFSL